MIYTNKNIILGEDLQPYSYDISHTSSLSLGVVQSPGNADVPLSLKYSSHHHYQNQYNHSQKLPILPYIIYKVNIITTIISNIHFTNLNDGDSQSLMGVPLILRRFGGFVWLSLSTSKHGEESGVGARTVRGSRDWIDEDSVQESVASMFLVNSVLMHAQCNITPKSIKQVTTIMCAASFIARCLLSVLAVFSYINN